MTDFDSFSDQLLEESKALLEKAKTDEPFTQSAYLHSSLLLAISALEACINSIVEEILIEPYRTRYTVYEQALLLEKDVRFDRGEYILSNGLKISRITDRIEFLYYKYTGKKLDRTYPWYATLKQSIDLRNKLVHPKENIQLTIKQVEMSILSVVNTIDELYKAVYQRKFPAVDRGIASKYTIGD
ncbi:Uncharacterised protein [uncultured Clostridium sp.]|uniref:RiboL-PSP-HEPN domain-containing protein n=1 Tax=Flintibacter hominis TaxID=2763048 RepID=A0A8J6J7Y3_9FIRM|nr:hypothetical protein [Flintibacter hominis]MBC5721592.1 hypothetical protein [Flintibacter hominis]SCH25027.1 Uncharacterised protein [uncultured Clostridium sp.]